ncbi:hypothetical protein, partial [Flavobacterium sp.]|uniref:hypothetical protein n=1 Tax=Flavobacterium sp. TaxID=239 RepID=UPI00334010D4
SGGHFKLELGGQYHRNMHLRHSKATKQKDIAEDTTWKGTPKLFLTYHLKLTTSSYFSRYF